MEHVLLNPVIWWGGRILTRVLIGVHFFHALAYCFYNSLTLTPLLLHWFHATNNSFSIIQFIARHKWNSKDNAVANEHRRCFWLQQRPGCQRKVRIFILRLPHIPIKTRKLHFQACGVNVIYRLERDRWWEWKPHVATLQWYHCSQCQWRNPPKTVRGQIKSINTCSCASITFLFTYVSVRPVWSWYSNLVHHLLLTPKHPEVMFGNGSKTQAQKWITILFIYPGLSVNHGNNQN